MGRTEPSAGRPPAGFRRDARAKRAKATINKVIPAVLAAHPRARKGVDASELIVDPPPPPSPSSHDTPPSQSQQHGQKPSRKDHHAADGGGGKEPSAEEGCKKIPRVALQVADTLAAAYSLLLLVPTPSSSSSSEQHQRRRDLSNKEARVGILNMASPLSPGGGFLNGASSQEESLCGRTTLLPALRDQFYRLPELGAVFTPDVLVFRGGGGGGDAVAEGEIAGDGDRRGGEEGEELVLAKGDRWFVDVVSAAMLRMPEIEVDEDSGWARYASAADRELAVSKMRAVMRVFCARGVRKVVLGAWGCGAYGNPVGEIARAWRKVLLGPAGSGHKRKGRGGKKERVADSWEGIEDVVFAIKDEGMAKAFAAAFGEDLLEQREQDLSEDEEEEEYEDTGVKELRDKVRDMELRIEQARTPQLRAGLNSVLAGLRSQLPGDGDSGQRPSQRNPTDHGPSSDEVSEGEEDGFEEGLDADDEDRSGH
ncbi:hypothetical protein F4820DRAFT_360212 [Hypoxylon rubiginosum]|uniref:Uncharacterized protein n=1 Tax=Hypoxylon rubiginosum TaxID=110542 RepID=A0ACB9YWS5_9PEZI|nr:hypothetical protein F4820DRAFT_360212 [Hypoxylon rubiginosum]